MKTVTVQEAQTHLIELLDEGAKEGEEILITGAGTSYMVRVTSVPEATRLVDSQQTRGGFGSAKGKIRMAENWDDPIPGFEPYTA